MARPLVDGLESLEGDFRTRLRGMSAGELNIAAGSSTILYLLPPLVQAFRAAHPEVQLKLHNVTGKDGLALIRSDEVDLAVGSMLDVPNDLVYAPVHSYDPMLITPLDHPLAGKADLKLEDLSPYGLILPPKRLTTYRLVDLVFQQKRVPYTVALEVGGWEVIKQYVAMGLGISIVTGICIEDDDRQRLAIRSLREWFPPRSYGVVIRKGKYLSPQARTFVELVKPALLGGGAGHSER
jgi:DNA-binding transcriptional LysR family regulator